MEHRAQLRDKRPSPLACRFAGCASWMATCGSKRHSRAAAEPALALGSSSPLRTGAVRQVARSRAGQRSVAPRLAECGGRKSMLAHQSAWHGSAGRPLACVPPQTPEVRPGPACSWPFSSRGRNADAKARPVRRHCRSSLAAKGTRPRACICRRTACLSRSGRGDYWPRPMPEPVTAVGSAAVGTVSQPSQCGIGQAIGAVWPGRIESQRSSIAMSSCVVLWQCST